MGTAALPCGNRRGDRRPLEAKRVALARAGLRSRNSSLLVLHRVQRIAESQFCPVSVPGFTAGMQSSFLRDDFSQSGGAAYGILQLFREALYQPRFPRVGPEASLF